MIRNGCSRVGLSLIRYGKFRRCECISGGIRDREGVSERTREAKARLWEQFLEAVARISLICYDVQFADVREKTGQMNLK